MFETSRKKACSGRGVSAGLRPAPAEARATATAKADFLWDGGMGPVAGDAASTPPGPGPAAGGCAFGRLRSGASQAKRPHPCKLGRRSHAAQAPATGPTPPSTVSCDLSEWHGVRSVFRRKTDLTPEFHSISDRFHPRMAWIYWPPAYCRRRGTVGLRGVSGMDAATKPPWMGLRRPRKPTVPRHPTECPPLLLRRLLPWLEAGAGLQALPNPPLR